MARERVVRTTPVVERRPAAAAIARSAAAAKPLSAARAMQQRLGHQGTQALIARALAQSAPTTAAPPAQERAGSAAPLVQRLATVSSPHDAAEIEAHDTARKVMRMPEPAPAAGPVRAPAGHSLQREMAPTPAALPPVRSAVPAAPGGGVSLPASVRGFMEPRFGANFGNVRIHAGEPAARESEALNAQAFTIGEHVFFGRNKFQPDTPAGRELIAHELTHTIQQGAVSQRRAVGSVIQRSAPAVQRLGFWDAVAGWARLIPGFTLFTMVIGVNPITMTPVERNALTMLSALLECIPGGALVVEALKAHGILQSAAEWVDRQVRALGMSAASIRGAMDRFTADLSVWSIANPSAVWAQAKSIFTEPIDRIFAFARSVVGGMVDLVRRAILLPLARLAEGTRGYDVLKAVLGQDPITGEAVPRTPDTLIGGFMKLIGQQELWENIKKANAVPRAWAWFQEASAGLIALVRQIPGSFANAVRSLELADLLLVPKAYAKVVGVFAGFVVQFVTWAGTATYNLLEIAFDAVAPAVMPYIRKTAGAFRTIISDPIGFVANLIGAAKLGFENFAGNFLTHLKAGLIEWLTGSLPGIYVPQSFSLHEIVKFVFSALGLTWQNIRAKLVKVVGEPAVKAMETGFDVVATLVKEGPAAAWDKIKDHLANLRDMVIGGITDFVVGTIVQKAIPKLVAMFIPGAGFVSAIVSIYDTVMVFVNKLSKIIQVVTGFLDSMASIAAGAIGAAATKVENTLAGALSLAINFLAGFVGLGGVADKVMGVINTVRAPIEKALDSLVVWILKSARDLLARVTNKAPPGTQEQALKSAVVEGTREMMVKDATVKSVREKLTPIKTKHKLAALDLILEQDNRYHLKASVNPTLEGPAGLLFTPEELVELDKVAREFAAHINKKDKEKPRSGFKATAMVDLEKFIMQGGKVQTGKMVEAMAAPALEELARGSGLTIIKNACIRWLDANGAPVGGAGPELDFLVLGPHGVQEVVSAKTKVGRVNIADDIDTLNAFHSIPDSGPALVALLMSGRYGAARDFVRVVSVKVTSNLGDMPLSVFRSRYLGTIPVPRIRITPVQPGPDYATGLQLRVTRQELAKKTVELMQKYL